MKHRLEERSSSFLRERIVSHRHPLGLEILYFPKRTHMRKFAVLAAKYGSIDNEFTPRGKRKRLSVPAGIAHFLEHQLFEMPYGNVFPLFGKLGADSNAFTSHTTTGYQFSCTTGFQKALALLTDFVFTPFFHPEMVDKERKIIEQEIKMYDDNPDWMLGFRLVEALYTRHPVRIDTAGTAGSIARITPENLALCHENFYHPSNMTLVLAGNVNVQRAVDNVYAVLKSKKIRRKEPPLRHYPVEPPGAAKKRITARFPVSRTKFAVGFKDDRTGDRGLDLLKKELTTSVILNLAFGRGSRAYARMYERGIIDDSFVSSYNGEETFGYTIIAGDTSRPDDLKEEIFRTLQGLESEFTEKNLRRIKKKALGRFLRSFNYVESPAMHLLMYHLSGIDIFDFPEAVKSISREDLEKRLGEHFKRKSSAVSLIEPA